MKLVGQEDQPGGDRCADQGRDGGRHPLTIHRHVAPAVVGGPTRSSSTSAWPRPSGSRRSRSTGPPAARPRCFATSPPNQAIEVTELAKHVPSRWNGSHSSVAGELHERGATRRGYRAVVPCYSRAGRGCVSGRLRHSRRNIALISHFETVKQSARSCIVVEQVSEASESDPRRLSGSRPPGIAAVRSRGRLHRRCRAGLGVFCCCSVAMNLFDSVDRWLLAAVCMPEVRIGA